MSKVITDLSTATPTTITELRQSFAFEHELKLAQSRLKDQERRLVDAVAVLSQASASGLHGLRFIAQKKVDRLSREVHDTRTCIADLNSLLSSLPSPQTDLESVAPPKDLAKSRPSR